MKKLVAAVVLAGLAFIACQKEYSIENNTDIASIGAWEFKDSVNALYTGNPVQYYIDDTTDPTSAHMYYSGSTASLNASLYIDVYFPTGTATPGTYTSANGEVSFLYRTTSGRSYKVDAFAGQFGTENISVTITAISDTSVTGIFSGAALDSANRLIPIRDGKFTYKKRGTATVPTISAGTLGTAADTCTGAVVGGTYRKGTAVTTANTVTVTANVTTAGTYSIYTDTLKGLHFVSTGTFTTTGVQPVTLAAVGTPTDSGTVTFRVRYGTSSCSFKVKIDTALGGVVVVPPTGDYFPTTTNSNWSYDIYDASGGLTDSVYVRSTGTFVTLGANAYNIFLDSDGDSTFYRKNRSLYYEGIDLSTTPLLGGGVQQTRMLIDSLPVNSTWRDSTTITVSAFPMPVTLRLNYTVTAKGQFSVGSNLFQDVIKVQRVFTYSMAGSPAITYETMETWYARGVGIVLARSSIAGTVSESRIRRWQVL
jgi:hypothetical protein